MRKCLLCVDFKLYKDVELLLVMNILGAVGNTIILRLFIDSNRESYTNFLNRQ